MVSHEVLDLEVVFYYILPVHWGKIWVHLLLVVSSLWHRFGFIWDQVRHLLGRRLGESA